MARLVTWAMNIFFLSMSPKEAAKFHANIHVVKMIVPWIFFEVSRRFKTFQDTLLVKTLKNWATLKWICHVGPRNFHCWARMPWRIAAIAHNTKNDCTVHQCPFPFCWSRYGCCTPFPWFKCILGPSGVITRGWKIPDQRSFFTGKLTLW